MYFGLAPKRVLELKNIYEPGTKVRLISMAPGDPLPLPQGLLGTVMSVDDTGQVHVAWENGRNLTVSEEYGDIFEKA